MSNALLMPTTDDRFARHTVETIDDWFHALPASEKARIFWIESQAVPVAGALYDEVRHGRLRITEAHGAGLGCTLELPAARLVTPAGLGDGDELDRTLVGSADGTAPGAEAEGFAIELAAHGPKLPNPVVDVAGPQVVVFDQANNHHTRIDLARAAGLAFEGVIQECTSYSDDLFDGLDVGMFFVVVNAEAWAKEVQR